MNGNGEPRWDDEEWVEGTDQSPPIELPASPTLDFPPDDWAHAFFAAYTGAHVCNLAASARAAGIHPKTVTARRDRDPDFADLLTQADDAVTEAVEQVVLERVVYGTRRPIFQHGEIVGHVREVDNRLAQWWLERKRPEKYHIATRIEHVNPDTPGAFTFRLGDRPLEIESGE